MRPVHYNDSREKLFSDWQLLGVGMTAIGGVAYCSGLVVKGVEQIIRNSAFNAITRGVQSTAEAQSSTADYLQILGLTTSAVGVATFGIATLIRILKNPQ